MNITNEVNLMQQFLKQSLCDFLCLEQGFSSVQTVRNALIFRKITNKGFGLVSDYLL